ncbi:AGE family epimerase/isomerase [Paracoccus sp. p4-l81]|uniref:AGE family epimerase/isomerase n=1 Tax=unclassified Paracoccus (in: a-proteobacteria) TaxID=2688777 RepID=UPI0035B9BFF3
MQMIDSPDHRAFLIADARRQLGFFAASLTPDGRFAVLDHDGAPLPDTGQELHTTTRLIHAYALGRLLDAPRADAIIDAGMAALWTRHRDADHGGFYWSFDAQGPARDDKLAYGHVFVLLAGASAAQVGHPDAARLIDAADRVLTDRFWDQERGLFADEFRRDWQPFSSYRGMNANMHGAEALLAAHEATGRADFLHKAGRILDFFVTRMAPAQGWRLPEHYTADWQIDPDYRGDPMFRPAGTTPGHSLEIARLALQHWVLSGRPDDGTPDRARALIQTALRDAWRADGGLVYTLGRGGAPAVRDRYWWPVTEAIGAVASLLRLDPRPGDADWYARLWDFAQAHLIDAERGGWFPELDEAGRPAAHQFIGKPDIYHALQADLIPLAPGPAHLFDGLRAALSG